MLSAPQPRSRLYTSIPAYGRGVAAALFGWGERSSAIGEFEQALERNHPGYRAVAVPMARVGIYLALKLSIRKGQKVILSPYTISDVVNMVLCAGGVPVFADIEEGGSFNISARAVEDLLDTEGDVGAVLVTHFYGLVCDILPIVAACQKRGIPIIEDAAQAFGATIDGQPAGAIGDVGVFSFGLLKNVTGFVGGAVLAKSDKLADAIRNEVKKFPATSRDMLRKKIITGASFDIATLPVVFDAGVYWLFRYAYLHDIAFFKNKLDTDSNPKSYSSLPAAYAHQMSGAQADIILPQFSHYRRQTEERVAKAQIYYDGLKDLPGVVLPPMRRDGSHIYLYYTIQSEERDRLALSMTRKLRDVQISHHRNCASLPCFSSFARDCPNAERAARNALYLPTYPGYRDDQVVANVEAIRAFLREGNA